MISFKKYFYACYWYMHLPWSSCSRNKLVGWLPYNLVLITLHSSRHILFTLDLDQGSDPGAFFSVKTDCTIADAEGERGKGFHVSAKQESFISMQQEQRACKCEPTVSRHCLSLSPIALSAHILYVCPCKTIHIPHKWDTLLSLLHYWSTLL